MARTARITAVLTCVGLLAACGGSRVSEERVIASEGGGPITVTAVPGTGADLPSGALPDGAPRSDADGTGAAPASTPAANVATAGGPTTNGGATTGQAPSAQGTGSGASAGGGGQASTACTKQGPPLILGQVTEASGIIGANNGQAIPVLQAWAKYINANGGIACRSVQVISQDSASDPAKASAQVRDLVQNKKAVALVANFVPLSISGFKSAVDELKVPVVGGDLFNSIWWADPLFYPVGTHVTAQAVGSTTAMAKAGADKVAVIYCIEGAICPPYKDAIRQYADSSGYSVVYDVQVSLTQPDFTSQCQSAKNAGATAINMIVDGSAVGRVARSCAAIGYFPKLAVASLGATFDQNDKNVRKASVSIASATHDWYSTEVPGQKALQESMKRYAPTVKLNSTAPLAWADGMMVKVAIEKLGAKALGVPITSVMVREGLAMVKNETLGGLVKPNSFSPTQGVNPPNPCYFAFVFSPPGKEGQWARATDGCMTGLKSSQSEVPS